MTRQVTRVYCDFCGKEINNGHNVLKVEQILDAKIALLGLVQVKTGTAIDICPECTRDIEEVLEACKEKQTLSTLRKEN